MIFDDVPRTSRLAAAQDVLRGAEDELAGHPVFGDARGILDRARTYSLLCLEALASRDFGTS